jgi:diguanylate cyclase (GGDEF)-like protein
VSTKVLVVDDDAYFRALVRNLLSERGHEVVEAPNGKAATAALASARPDMVIVDGLLPDTDGMQWMTARRKDGVKTPFVFVSSFWKDLDSFKKLTTQLGVAAVLHKPIVPASFCDQIEAALEAAGVRVARPAGTRPPPVAVKPTPPVPMGPGAPTLAVRTVKAPVDAVAATAPQPIAPPATPPLIKTSDASAMLAAVTAEYAQSLPAKVSQLRQMVDHLRDGQRDVEHVRETRSLAHRMSGTAGSYGFERVGDAARAVEKLVLELMDGVKVTAFQWMRATHDLDASLAIPVPVEDESTAKRQAAREAHSPTRVLVVDDDPEFLRLTATLGRERAIDIVGAGNSAEALAIAADTPPDAAIIDLRLDKSDRTSFDLARALRAVPGCEKLPIAFVSVQGGLADRIAATHAGASLYLSKPLDAEQLSSAVHQLTASARSSRPRMLVVDDDSDFARHVLALVLDSGLQTSALTDPSNILEALEDVRPDVLLLDVEMGKFSGFDICRMIRTIPKWQDVIILFVTSLHDTASRVAAFQAGADDYLMKPLIKEELLARIRVRVERNSLLRERLDRDTLTGLPLRRTFLEQLSARMSESRRRSRVLSLALLDVDHFKTVNDKHGHLVGDRVLAALGNLLLRRFRGEDLRARWGGEEFILAFAEERPETVAAILGRVLQEFSEMEFHDEDGRPFNVTFSAGVAWTPADADRTHSLIECADRRLYAAKVLGRNRIEYTDGPQTPSGGGGR